MTFLTDPLMWCVIQVTLVGVLAWALCAAVRRWSAPGNAAVPAAALAAVVVLTFCAFAPWPGWWRFAPRWDQTATVNRLRNDPVPSDHKEPGKPMLLADPANDASPRPEEDPADAPQAQATTGFDTPEVSTSPPTAAPRLALPGWLGSAVAVLLAIGIVGGLLQLALGLFSVRQCRRRSRPLDDSELRELLDILQAELGLTCRIELRECEQLTTAATIGWRRPVILLPPGWRDWTGDQRRAVLAHELAHVASGDYVACLLAQFGLALHFYHPLVHWLVARLRLEQELAADATAAALAGGRRTYLTSLAELALYTQERSLGWPAHTFLPTPGTFLRRIEMLRDSKPVTSAAPRRRWAIKWAAVGLLAAGAALVAGLRGGPSISPFDREAAAQAPAATGAGAAAASVIDLKHVTNDARFFLIARPAEAMAQPEIKHALTSAVPDAPPVLKLLTSGHLQQITLIGPAGLELNELNDQVIVVLQFDQPTSLDDLAKTGVLPKDIKALNSGAANDNDDLAGSSLNENTLAIGGAESLLKYLTNRRKGKPAIAAGAAWEKVQKGTIVAALDMELVRDTLAAHKPEADAAAQIGALAPLWQDSEYLVAGIILEGKSVHFRAVATCDNGELASDVAETTQAAVTLARNSLRSLREREKDVPALALLAIQTAEGLLKTMKIERAETLVVAQTSATVPDVKTIATSGLVESVSAARASAQRLVSMNNLKQIMLALHNWADAHGGQFPPPVIYGKDGKGKVPHSWRIELLPYLEQAALYESYKFDESWDSEANKAVLAKMPPVFRHPADNEKSTHSAYFALTPAALVAEGDGPVLTAFGKRDGVRFADIIDGTSNTLAVVEAKREIPWTRPDDIVFDPAKDPPTLGGWFKDGFHAALCDGSVRFISHKIDAAMLKLLISPQGGEPVPQF